MTTNEVSCIPIKQVGNSIINYCATRIFPNSDQHYSFIMVSIYIPPKGKDPTEQLIKILNSLPAHTTSIWAGDFNCDSYNMDQVLEKMGAYEISNRANPTYKNTITSTCPDRIIVVPSGEWDPLSTTEDNEEENPRMTKIHTHTLSLPTDVIWEGKISDHATLFLKIPLPHLQKEDFWTSVIENLNPEDWAAIDDHFGGKKTPEIKTNSEAMTSYMELISNLNISLSPFQKKIKISGEIKVKKDFTEANARHFPELANNLKEIRKREKEAIEPDSKTKIARERYELENKINQGAWKKKVEGCKNISDLWTFFARANSQNTSWNKRAIKKPFPPYPITQGTVTAKTTHEKASLLADHFQKKFNEGPPPPPSAEYYKYTRNANLEEPVTKEELLHAIEDLSNSSPGEDKIHAEVWKNLPQAATHLLPIINHSLRTGYIPEKMGHTTIIPLHRTGKGMNTSAFRPISLIPTSAKIMESILLKRIIREIHPLLPKAQYGFRRHMSTEMLLVEMLEDIREKIHS